MSYVPEILTDRLVFRNFDCNRESTDDFENKMYYKFFNEWWGLTHVKIDGVLHKIIRNSYDGVVFLSKVEVIGNV